ncbi:MAG: aromatic ring-hydroxylating dioxygenase subunit alpha, partial [Alphaproteobacteria bacterium]
HDAFAIETQGPIQDRTKELLGSSDIVITAVRRTLMRAIKQIEAGNEAPGLIRDPSKGFFADFVCTAAHIDDHEDGPSFSRRILAARSAAE